MQPRARATDLRRDHDPPEGVVELHPGSGWGREYEVIVPAVVEPDVWTVAMGNGLYVDACHACWLKWPDAHKVFPAVGFGRWPAEPADVDRLVEILQETAP